MPFAAAHMMKGDETMDRILQILAELRPDVDFTLAQNLIDDGVLDSFDVVSLVSELCDAFEVSISVDDLTPENFNTPEAMLALVERLQNDERLQRKASGRLALGEGAGVLRAVCMRVSGCAVRAAQKV